MASEFVSNFISVIMAELEDVWFDFRRKFPVRHAEGFREYVREHIRLEEVGRGDILLEEAAVQFNPDRFENYKSVHRGVYDRVLKISDSPHCELLSEYEKRGEKFWDIFKRLRYYRMQRRYGKSRKRSVLKARKLINLYDSIKNDGFEGEIIVLNKPLIENPYNSGYEIFDGHHRAACCVVLGIKKLPGRIMRVAENSGAGLSSFPVYKSVRDIRCRECEKLSKCGEGDERGDYSLKRCQRLLEQKNYSSFQNMDVLEVGCGDKEKGGFIKSLVESNNCSWTGVDVRATDLASYVCGVEKMPFNDNSFDAVVGSQTMEHWADTLKGLREIHRVVKVGGIVSLTVPIHLHGNKEFVQGDIDSIERTILKAGFNIEKVESMRREHEPLRVYPLNDYNKKKLRKTGITDYNDVEIYILHFVLKK